MNSIKLLIISKLLMTHLKTNRKCLSPNSQGFLRNSLYATHCTGLFNIFSRNFLFNSYFWLFANTGKRQNFFQRHQHNYLQYLYSSAHLITLLSCEMDSNSPGASASS